MLCSFVPTTIMPGSSVEKLDAFLSLPLPFATPASKRDSFRRKVVLYLGFILCGIYLWCDWKGTLRDIFDKGSFIQPQLCVQTNVLTPDRNGVLWDSLSSTVGTEAFKAKAVEWISGAVRVP